MKCVKKGKARLHQNKTNGGEEKLRFERDELLSAKYMYLGNCINNIVKIAKEKLSEFISAGGFMY
jgi:hypothetical protein